MWSWVAAVGYLLLAEGAWVAAGTLAATSAESGGLTPSFAAPGLVALGVVLVAAGGVLSLVANYYLIAYGNGTPLPIRPAKELVTTGPYRVVRNPQAIGLIAVTVGTALAIEGTFIWALPVIAVLYHQMGLLPWERRHLTEAHGDDYLEYRASVPAWLPRLGSARLSG